MGIVVSSIVCQDRSRPGISITGRCASPRHGTVLRAALYRESGFVQWPKAAVIGIHPGRQLSGDKLPIPGHGNGWPLIALPKRRDEIFPTDPLAKFVSAPIYDVLGHHRSTVRDCLSRSCNGETNVRDLRC
jgi:hypothetical protein